MPRFSGYGPPFQYYRPYNYRSYNYRARTPAPEPPPPPNPVPAEPPKLERSYSQKPKPDTPVWFDLFGIKLYFDDVLILSLLFFLYREEVKDEGLFLALVLLLIS